VLGQNFDDLPFDFYPGTQSQHFLYGALANQRVQPGLIFDYDRHTPTYEVERDLVNRRRLFCEIGVA
jgi:hypothetical protein